MFARSLFVASALGSALALYTVRDDVPADQDLLASCPGGPGSSNIAGATSCTLINIVNNPGQRLFSILGDPQLKYVTLTHFSFSRDAHGAFPTSQTVHNCGGSSEDVTVTLGGESTVGSTTSVNANLGISIEGISLGGGIESSTSSSQTVSKSIMFTVKPGRQAVYVLGTNYHSQTGNVQVDYHKRQFGHFIWFTGSTVTQLSPDTSDVVFDVHETACGTDARDLNNSS